MSSDNSTPNRLIDETSPYLLQHAYNPVEWYPWGEQAINLAREEDRLILLSIGYSACHWCHVMERESFENEDIAQLMNDNFINIKVDREERPDLDTIYQTAHQLFNERPGGWPLTAFLTPDEHAPIFVGTYFPPTQRGGMPSFSQILTNIAERYQERRGNLAEHNRVMKEAFGRLRLVSGKTDQPVDESLMETAVKELVTQYDPVYGGFGGAPKFPHTTQLQVLLSYWQLRARTSHFVDRSLEIAIHTLEAMSQGGLYDHLGGGFCRYSVDARWEIPHFEKMLYDNALMLPLLVETGRSAGRDDFHETAIETGLWAIREMQSEKGGYFSTLDADSEGEEGKFYVWTVNEVNDLLSHEEFKAFEVRYGLRGQPNFEGKWHLRVANSLDVVSKRSGLPPSEVRSLLQSARAKLFNERKKRVHPGRDEKILTSWNGLMIKAMANAGRMLGRSDFIESAESALDFIRSRMWKNGRLLVTAKDDEAHLNAYLDDYAYLAEGVLELLQARWRTEDLEFAIALTEVLLNHFVDEESGAFCFTSDDHETLLYRSVPTHDDATPSGNGVAAHVLIKLSYLTGDTRYLEAAARVIKGLQAATSHMPSSFGASLVAIEDMINPGTFLVIRGGPEKIGEWAEACTSIGPLNMMVFAIPDDAVNLPQSLAEKTSEGPATAYVCTGFSCLPPCVELDDLMEQIPKRPAK